MAEANFQISEKLTDTAIFVVRGEDYVDFSNNITAVAEDADFREDMDKFITQVTGRGLVSTAQAVANVQQFVPQAAPVQQQGAPTYSPQQQESQSFSCAHGARTYREGRRKDGGQWSGYFCPQKGSDCKVMNPDGSFWNK